MKKLMVLITLLAFGRVAFADPTPRKPDPSAQSVALDKGQPAPFDGVLITEEKAVAAHNIKLDFDKLKLDYDSDSKAWALKEAAYQGAVKSLQDENAKLQPTWYDEHKLELGVVLGLVAGVALTVGVVKAVNAAK